MKPNEIVKDIMKSKGLSNQALATLWGKSTASAVSTKLSRENGMRIDIFLEMVNLMDCDVVVRSKIDGTEWVVSSKDDKTESVEGSEEPISCEEHHDKRIKLIR